MKSNYNSSVKLLIIGFGSIGKRHYEIFKEFDCTESISIVTKQNLPSISTYKNLSDIKDLNAFDYFIISSETVKHYEQLKYLCGKVKNKKILVEKPLYDKLYGKLKCRNNDVFIAYNLRFHPVLIKLKELLNNKKIYFANIICGQFLPTWRPGEDYKKSYSADIKKGGGVLRDLSHELDYVNWLFGEIEKIEYINSKISDLEINSDDIFTAIAVTKNKTIINLTTDYISKTPIRRMIIHTQNSSIEVDIINFKIIINNKEGKMEVVELINVDRNYTYIKMHEALLNNEIDDLCSFSEGEKIIEFIDSIKYRQL